MDLSPPPNPEFKIVMLGDSGVGKTSLIEKFYTGNFTAKPIPTIGAAFIRATISLPKQCITLNIWDTAGQERFQSLATLYVREARGVVLVADASIENSLSDLEIFYSSVKGSLPTDTQLILCVNKIDLVPEHFDTTKFALWANERHMSLMRTSAKTGDGVAEVFTQIALDILDKDAESQKPQLPEVDLLDIEAPADRWPCC
jgi:small GTP-binding protein